MKSNKNKALWNRLTSAIKSCIIAIEVMTVRIVGISLFLRKKVALVVRRIITFVHRVFLLNQSAKAQKEKIMKKFMENPRAFVALVAIIATALLVACGGGGGGSAPAVTPVTAPVVTPTVATVTSRAVAMMATSATKARGFRMILLMIFSFCAFARCLVKKNLKFDELKAMVLRTVNVIFFLRTRPQWTIRTVTTSIAIIHDLIALVNLFRNTLLLLDFM